ncbi:unnamed protein product [Peronospora destructor]|uniref:No apical meristem-associated C-terminal domain-containing protein n=1 Tax=Peronospora destructor TaxID=86335 RepID=A0AAV0SZW5_9STRA|nr:unnamed protein product [Peronospora destructor]
MSSLPLNRRKSKAAWSKEDDVRLCRSFVFATQDSEGTEHVKNMWNRLYKHYAALAAEDPDAAPRAVGALQTHWSSFVRPEVAFFMLLLVKTEKEEHESWKEEDFIEKTKNHFEAIRQKEEADAMCAYSEAKQLAVLEDADLPPHPRTKPTKFRYVHCISVLKTSKRFMRAVTSAKTPREGVRSSTQKRPKLPSDADQAVNASEASDDSVSRRESSPPQHEPFLKRSKGGDAPSSFCASAPESRSSSSSSYALSSVVKVPVPSGVAVAAVTPSPIVAPSNTLNSKIPGIDALNGRHLSAKTPVLQIQHTQQKANYRLKLLNELRGIVETISQLANQFASTMAVPNVSASSRLDPTLVEEMQQDLRFFREQKSRLKQELDALDAEGQS